jgi:hypothetical protein
MTTTAAGKSVGKLRRTALTTSSPAAEVTKPELNSSACAIWR